MKQTLVRPLITEKATQMTKSKVYCFIVDQFATKHAIKHTIENLFKVKVDGVRITIRKGKVKRLGRRMQSKVHPDVKIALVTLKDGEIDIFPKA